MANNNLSIKLSADVAKFQGDMRAAGNSTQQAMTQMQRSADSVKGAMQSMAAGIVGALSVGALAASVKGVADYADEMGKMSQRVGVAIEQLSGLTYAAGLSDVSNEALGNGLKKLSKLMSEANGGMDQQKRILKELGVTETKNASQAFLQLADRFSKMEEGTGKTAAAIAVFGKSGADLLPLLNSGADGIRAATDEAERFGLIVGKDAADAAEKFNDNLTRLATLKKGAQVSLFGDLVIGIGNATQAFLDGVREGGKWRGIILGIQTLLTGDDRHKNNVALVEDTEKLMQAENALVAARASGMNPAGIAAREKWVADLKDRIRVTMGYKQLLDKADALPTPAKTGKVNNTIFSTTGTSKGPTDAQKIEADAQRFVARLREQAETYGKSGAAVLEYQMSLSKFPKIYQDEAIALQQRIDNYKTADDEQKTFFDNAVKASDDRIEMLNRLVGATASAELDRQRTDMMALADWLEKGVISEKIYLEAVTARLDLVADKTDKAKTAADEFGMTMASAFEDAIVGGKDFGDVLDGLIQDMARMTIRKAVTDPMSNFISGAITSFLPSFDVGTNYVPRDMIAKIHKGEKIIPAAQNNGSQNAAPIYVTQNFTVGDVASISMVRQAVAGSERRIAAGIGRSMAYGGAMS